MISVDSGGEPRLGLTKWVEPNRPGTFTADGKLTFTKSITDCGPRCRFSEMKIPVCSAKPNYRITVTRPCNLLASHKTVLSLLTYMCIVFAPVEPICLCEYTAMGGNKNRPGISFMSLNTHHRPTNHVLIYKTHQANEQFKSLFGHWRCTCLVTIWHD